MLISKVGEKWQSFTQKFDVLYATKALPWNTKPFIVNSNFELYGDDNYISVELVSDKSIKEHNNVITDGIDESPFAGDEFNASISLGVLCSGFVLIISCVIYASKKY